MTAIRSSGVLGVLCAAANLLLAASSVRAEPLDEPACNRLKNEQARLASEGLKTDMLRGPAWAKANLPQAKLDEIKQLMDIEEQLAFRCPLPKPPPSPTTTAAAPANDAAPGEAKGPPVKKKARNKKKAQEATDGGGLLDALPAPDAAPTTDEKPKKAQKKAVKPKKKEPANDAYVPPPATGNAFVDGEAGPVPQSPANAPAQGAVTP